MSIHKLTAGSGYDYLTRQVAALDATEKGHTGLASYYAERGETPGGVDRLRLLPADAPLPAADRARVRTDVAREFFLAAHGREPIDARELAGQIAKDSRPRIQTVAGYDLTFSPVKSVSTLWAVAGPAVAAVIEQAQQAAVKDALAFIEKHALFTRSGPQGIRQVNVRGLVAAAFTHRDSRAGDPDLHTQARRSQLIADLADHIRHHADHDGTQPHWVPQGSSLRRSHWRSRRMARRQWRQPP